MLHFMRYILNGTKVPISIGFAINVLLQVWQTPLVHVHSLYYKLSQRRLDSNCPAQCYAPAMCWSQPALHPPLQAEKTARQGRPLSQVKLHTKNYDHSY